MILGVTLSILSKNGRFSHFLSVWAEHDQKVTKNGTHSNPIQNLWCQDFSAIRKFVTPKIADFEISQPYVTNFGQNLRVKKATKNWTSYRENTQFLTIFESEKKN